MELDTEQQKIIESYTNRVYGRIEGMIETFNKNSEKAAKILGFECPLFRLCATELDSQSVKAIEKIDHSDNRTNEKWVYFIFIREIELTAKKIATQASPDFGEIYEIARCKIKDLLSDAIHEHIFSTTGRIVWPLRVIEFLLDDYDDELDYISNDNYLSLLMFIDSVTRINSSDFMARTFKLINIIRTLKHLFGNFDLNMLDG